MDFTKSRNEFVHIVEIRPLPLNYSYSDSRLCAFYCILSHLAIRGTVVLESWSGSHHVFNQSTTVGSVFVGSKLEDSQGNRLAKSPGRCIMKPEESRDVGVLFYNSEKTGMSNIFPRPTRRRRRLLEQVFKAAGRPRRVLLHWGSLSYSRQGNLAIFSPFCHFFWHCDSVPLV